MVSTIVRETERKYEAADGVELPGWPGLAGVEALVGPEEQTVEAVYYDTEDLRLARAGVDVAPSMWWGRRGLAPQAADGQRRRRQRR